MPLCSPSQHPATWLRHSISWLDEVSGEKPKTAKIQALSSQLLSLRGPSVHIDIAESQMAEGKLYPFVGISSTSKFAVTQLVDKVDLKTAWEFLEHILNAVLYRIHPTPAENGIQFADQPHNRNQVYSRPMHYDMICDAHDIERRLTNANHPWTNGQVGRMNRTIKDATSNAYSIRITSSSGRTLKALNGLTPCEYICISWTTEPERSTLDLIHQMSRLNS